MNRAAMNSPVVKRVADLELAPSCSSRTSCLPRTRTSSAQGSRFMSWVEEERRRRCAFRMARIVAGVVAAAGFFRFWNRADPFVLIGPLQRTTAGSTEKREDEEGRRRLEGLRGGDPIVTDLGHTQHRERAIFFPRSTAIRQRHGPFFPFRSRSKGFGYGYFQSLQLTLWLCFDGNGEGPRRLEVRRDEYESRLRLLLAKS